MSSTPPASRQPIREGGEGLDRVDRGTNVSVLLEVDSVDSRGSIKLFDARRYSWHSGPKYLCMQRNITGFGPSFCLCASVSGEAHQERIFISQGHRIVYVQERTEERPKLRCSCAVRRENVLLLLNQKGQERGQRTTKGLNADAEPERRIWEEKGKQQIEVKQDWAEESSTGRDQLCWVGSATPEWHVIPGGSNPVSRSRKCIHKV